MKISLAKYLIILNLMLVGGIVCAQSVGNYNVSRTTGNTYSSIENTGISFSAWRYTGNFSEDDNRSIATEIGFDFWYNGTRYTEFSVSTNGFLDFSSSTDDGGPQCDAYGYCNTFFSNSAGTLLALAPFYDDMTTGAGSDPLGSSIKYLISGTAPYRILTVEWIGMAVYQDTSPDVNFQVKIYETEGVIEYWYGTMESGDNTFSYTTGINASAISRRPRTTELLTQQAANSSTFSNSAEDNLSTMPIANSKLVFSPPNPTNPSNLTINGVTNTGMTLNWSDLANNEVGYVLYYSLDNSNYFFYDQIPENSQSSVITGLLPSTTYYWKVSAVTEGKLSTALTANATTEVPGDIISSQNGRWDRATTWVGGDIPGASDNVIIADTHIVTVRSNSNVCNDLIIGQGSSGQLRLGRNNNNTAYSITVNGDVLINTGAVFNARSTSNTTHTVNLNGNLTNNGTFDMQTDGDSFGLVNFIKDNGNQTVSGSGITTNFHTINLTKGVKSNTVEITSDLFTCNADALTFVSGGTFKFSSTGSNSFSLYNTTRAIPTNGKIIMNSPNSTMNFGGGIDLQGDFQLTEGIVNIGGIADNNLTVNGGVILIEGGALNIAGRLDRNTTESATNYTQTGGTLTLPIIGSTSTTLSPFNADVIGSTFSMSAGTIVLQREGGNGGQDLGINTTGVSLGSVTGGLLQIGDALTPAGQIIGISLGTSIGNLLVNSANVSAAMVGANLDVLSDITLTNGTLIDNGNSITIAGDWISTGGAYIGGSQVDFIGGNQSITSGTSIFNNIDLSGSGSKTLSDNLSANGNMTINSALSLGASPLQINLGGNWLNNGAFTRNGETLNLTGAGAQSIGGTSLNSFTNISVNKSGGGISNEGQLDLNGTLTISSVTAMDLDGTGSGVFRLVSSPSDDARIAALASGASLSGDMVFEKYFAGSGIKYWRHIGSPVFGATVADLQEEIPISGTFIGNDNGTGSIPIWAYPSLAYYDANIGLPSGVFDDRWVIYPIAENNETLTGSGSETRGYTIWIDDAGPIFFELTGAANYGTFDYNLSGANERWNFIANPYPSDIDWDASGWTKTNIQGNAIHVFNGVQYLFWDGSMGNLGNGRIAKGQGFWVQASTASPQLISTEDVKTASVATTHRILSSVINEQIIEFSLRASGYQDKAYVQFNELSLDTYDSDDVGKFYNSIFNIATMSVDSVPLSINKLPAGECDLSIPLKINNTWNDNYSLVVSTSSIISSGYNMFLRDNFTGLDYDLETSPNVEFAITDDENSKNPERFILNLFPRSLNPELVLEATQACEYDKSAIIHLGSSQVNAEYEIYVNDQLDTLISGTGEPIDLMINSNLITGMNQIVIKSIGLGCLEETVSFTESISIIDNPVIQYDPNTSLLISQNNIEGLWYRNQELVSDMPTSFIEPDRITGGIYVQVISNGSCDRSSNEFLVTSSVEETLSNKISISPNPAVTQVSVLFSGKVDKLRITDISGRIYYENLQLLNEIDISNFDSGIYFVTIYSGQEKFTQRFIKQ